MLIIIVIRKDFLKKLGINTDEPNYKPPLNDLMVNYNQNGIGTINMIMGTSYTFSLNEDCFNID